MKTIIVVAIVVITSYTYVSSKIIDKGVSVIKMHTTQLEEIYHE